MLAAVTRSPGEMVIEDVSCPGPVRAGNVIVRPEAVGICGSDFHLFSGDVAALSGARDFYPRIQGHEVSALVEDPGEATALKEGDRVAIWPLLPCGTCYPCRAGRPNVCPRFRLVGVHLDGGLQQRLEVPAPTVFGVGDLDPDSTAFVEPASVAVHALARANLGPGEQAVVFGAGPIGLATTLAATQAGARVTTVDPVPARRDLAKLLGAERVTWASPDDLHVELEDWTSGDGPPLVVETSGETAIGRRRRHVLGYRPAAPRRLPGEGNRRHRLQLRHRRRFPHCHKPGKSKPGLDRRAFFPSFPADSCCGGVRIRHETTTGCHQDRGDRELKTKPELTTEEGER